MISALALLNMLFANKVNRFCKRTKRRASLPVFGRGEERVHGTQSEWSLPGTDGDALFPGPKRFALLAVSPDILWRTVAALASSISDDAHRGAFGDERATISESGAPLETAKENRLDPIALVSSGLAPSRRLLDLLAMGKGRSREALRPLPATSFGFSCSPDRARTSDPCFTGGASHGGVELRGNIVRQRPPLSSRRGSCWIVVIMRSLLVLSHPEELDAEAITGRAPLAGRRTRARSRRPGPTTSTRRAEAGP